MFENIKRGEVYYADLGNGVGSIQSGMRPVLVLQNNIGNQFSPTTIVAPLTSKLSKNRLPVHYCIEHDTYNGLKTDSVVMLEQIRIIDKTQIRSKIGKLKDEQMYDILSPLMMSLGIDAPKYA